MGEETVKRYRQIKDRLGQLFCYTRLTRDEWKEIKELEAEAEQIFNDYYNKIKEVA